jgi:hypothetical protein
LSKCRIQRAEAVAIAAKLGASIRKDGAHQLASFEYEGKLILTFGIRNGKNSGHGHLVGRNKDLRLNETKLLELATCSMSKAEYVDHLKAVGDII